METRGKMIRCWHPEQHAHGDRTPSVGVWTPANRVRCFGIGCDETIYSPIDLVMDVKGISSGAAIEWIAERFEVPLVQTGGRTALPANGDDVRNADPLRFLVCSGIWSQLSLPAKAVVPVLLDRLDDSENFEVSVSYRAFQRYAGLGSPSSVRKALEELYFIGWLRPVQETLRSRDLPIRKTGRYLLTPLSPLVRRAGDSLRGQWSQDIKREIDQAKTAREEREYQLRRDRKPMRQKRPP